MAKEGQEEEVAYTEREGRGLAGQGTKTDKQLNEKYKEDRKRQEDDRSASDISSELETMASHLIHIGEVHEFF